MSVTFPYPYGYDYSGWNCGTCGAWVPNGCTHFCPSNVNPSYVAPQPPTVPDPLTRIAHALEQIVGEIEAAKCKTCGRIVHNPECPDA